MLGWTLLGVFWATRWYILFKNAKDPITWSESLLLGLVEWYLWGIFSVAIFKLCARLRFDRMKWRMSLVIHLVAGSLISLVHVFIYASANRSIDYYYMHGVHMPGLETVSDAFWLMLRNRFHTTMLTYALIAVASYVIAYARRHRQEELLAAELRTRLAGAQLQALKAQLQPHFLFNTLHTISALMREDVEAADRVEKYLEVERIRFSDRLRTEIHVSPQALDVEVPNLILQPLVENAIRHGITPKAAGGTVRVSAVCEGEKLRLEVSDDGVGLDRTAQSSNGNGVGLANVRERLQQLYGDRCRFSMVDSDGLTITIHLPLQPPILTSSTAQE
ncbi:MAG: histidine kinase [candidate division Zixibacteria bacterium]|nr:histidine kinase [candidate division Zixibacteria bacterium]